MNQELKQAFKDYCERKGLNLLRDDYNYIERQLNKCPAKLHKSILKRYLIIWMQGEEKKENARYRANQWLRESVEKYLNGTKA